jgi:flavin reductase (DIM6/NTAB) family NADH-FMN oxidoreductase RutF
MNKANITDFSKLLGTFPCFPTVLVTCEENIVTLALVHIFSFNPPLIGIGIAPKRHSHGLINKNKEFVVNMPTKNLLSQTNFCGTKSGRDTDKFKETGLTKEASKIVKSVSIKECPVNLECKVVQEIETGDHKWFIGEVVNGKIADDFKIEDTVLYWRGLYRSPGVIIKQR